MEGLHSSGKLFAGDAKVYRRIWSPDDGIDLQEDSHQLQLWIKKWLLNFNEDKYSDAFQGKEPRLHIHDGGTTFIASVKERDLGIIIKPDLKVSEEVTRAAAVANSMLGKVEKTFTYMDKEMVLSIYKTVVRPHMEYAIQAWSPFLQKVIGDPANGKKTARAEFYNMY